MMSPLVSGAQLFAKQRSLSEDDGPLRRDVTNNEHPCCHKWTFRCWFKLRVVSVCNSWFTL